MPAYFATSMYAFMGAPLLVILVLTLAGRKPVSYTHLDVYKRQADALSEYKVAKVNSLTVRVGVLANVMPAAFEFAFEALTDDTIFSGARPVSYTHLDVYKRQIYVH